MSKNKRKNKDCSLFPYTVKEVLSIQDAKQKAGWNVTAFDLPEAWKASQGRGVTVAVIDSGCDLDHPDLVDNLVPGYNFVNEGHPPEDDNMHGTHVSGTICAENNDIGMVGIAPAARVMPVKVLDSNGDGNLIDVAKGIRWAVDNGAHILCMSLGSPRPIQEVRKALQYAESKGVATFCAAGNAGKTTQVFYPAAYPETVAIGSIDENLDRSSFSNTGDQLDFMAPGGKIFSTVPDNWYAELSGTSMAAPFAVGVAALVLSYVRDKNLDVQLRTSKDYIELFKKYTTPIVDPECGGKAFFQGFGIIDPRKLCQWYEDNQGTAQQVVKESLQQNNTSKDNC